jgi:hypothetical protein
MMNIRFFLAPVAAALFLYGCAVSQAQFDRGYLSEDAVINLMKHPRKWNGKTVTVKIFPYDNGFRESYIVCFEACDSGYAENSPFVIYTARDRFKGYKGDRPAVVTAKYSSICFYKAAITCVHIRAGQFTEIL